MGFLVSTTLGLLGVSTGRACRDDHSAPVPIKPPVLFQTSAQNYRQADNRESLPSPSDAWKREA